MNLAQRTNQKYAVENYHLIAGNGRHVRIATKVVFFDGSEIKFTEKMPKEMAISQALTLRAKERQS